jgi:two-component system sensor histidine kinase KdpD
MLERNQPAMVDRDRPNPDDLLARVVESEAQKSRGRLKVFFGAAPGVGKTFAMLEAARLQQSAGVEVVAGVVETHNRKETEALLEGLEILPRRTVSHRNVTLHEFDVDAALLRKPELLLVDELAHTNAPGSRHLKRWQDVMELVDAGISVYTTLNVQHLDSLNDVVAQVTGVAVRETLPDSVLDRADDIELVDLPVNELLIRLNEGKVYIPDQAQLAMSHFFRPGNLIALREMALRRTADRVDAQMRTYRIDHAIQPTWPVTERLIVSVGPSPFSAKLIRAAKRMSDRLHAEWIAAFVETPAFASAPEDARDRVFSSLRLAEQLGAETVTLTGEHVAEALLHYARARNVSKIVLGKQQAPLWKRLLRGSVLDELIEKSGDIEIYAISGEPGTPLHEAQAIKPSGAVSGKSFVFAAAVVAACTILCVLLRSTLNPVNLVMFYLLGIVAIAMRSTRRVALAASLISVAAFDFFCVPPYLTFAVSDYEYLLTFVVMLVVAVTISTLTIRIRTQAAHAVDREVRTQALFRLSKELSGDRRDFDAARAATEITREVFGCDAIVFLPDATGKISFSRRTTDALPLPRAEEGVAQWAFDHNQRAGKSTDTLPGSRALYLPMRGSGAALGVMAVLPDSSATTSPEQIHLLELFATQIALAMERSRMAAEARQAKLRMETEQMRSSLLSAVSHDLRTPLASITGAASSLLSHKNQLDPATQEELLESIAQEAQRLSRLVNNLLEITRLESGAVEVSRDWHSLEEIVGAALNRLDKTLGGRPVRLDIPAELPLIAVDGMLLEQVFSNLLENAAKYTPEGSEITVSASIPGGDKVIVEVSDRGPGFAPGDETLVWEKFYRAARKGSRGVGLGLPICKAIIAAHAGTIEAANRAGGGALIRIILPVGGEPPQVSLDE